ncbi:hypothetical protein IEQ44_00410 [Nocardioides sp. Y6]|uniref:Secreted protein n=1 Tax=Nocardioides malaquae TaxID=2773426 RepID=A0ABR9RNG7_9ACTN|nr:hypothetical protein [Nocardioides malaquae]MBE7323111.1 hypothetical protein [Nocardioides malaquae]
MSEASWAVVGVIVGSILPFLTGLLSERRADKRASDDRQERREDRLFDARRAAFEKYQSIARSLLDQAWEAHAGLSEAPPLDYNFTDPLVEALGAVRLYASGDTVKAAEALLHAVRDYATGDVADAPDPAIQNSAFAHVDAAIEMFSATARADLGATRT